MIYPTFSKRASLKAVNSQRQLEKAAEEPDAEEFLRRFKEHADASIENAYEYVATFRVKTDRGDCLVSYSSLCFAFVLISLSQN
jgi:hypothetical protein